MAMAVTPRRPSLVSSQIVTMRAFRSRIRMRMSLRASEGARRKGRAKESV
jgi:hypothetical protein